MKTNKSKGFTLIELMVVISIIALLSSVVLASLKTAREKAESTKAVGELKAIQTALELYRAKFNTYPEATVDEDEAGTLSGHTGFNNFIKTNLVDKKFMSKAPQSKNYPNNCIQSECYYGNMFYYFNDPSSYNFTNNPDWYYMCGGQRLSNYVLGYVTTQKLNLPMFTVYYFGTTYTGLSWEFPGQGESNQYCLTM